MHIVRFGIRRLAGASLIAWGLAAAPVFATTRDAAAPAFMPASGPILSGRIYDATGVALPGARVVVEGTGARRRPTCKASSASSPPRHRATSPCWSTISAARRSPASWRRPIAVATSR